MRHSTQLYTQRDVSMVGVVREMLGGQYETLDDQRGAKSQVQRSGACGAIAQIKCTYYYNIFIYFRHFVIDINHRNVLY